jgi:hypothetical protein
MTPGWHKVIVAASLHNVGDRSAVDLKIESYVPSKVRGPQNDQTPTRSGGCPDRRYANKNENEKDCIGGGVSWLHGLTLLSGRAFGERGVHRLLDSLSRLARHS